VLSPAPGHAGLDSDFRRNDGEFGLVSFFQPSRGRSECKTLPALHQSTVSFDSSPGIRNLSAAIASKIVGQNRPTPTACRKE